MSIIEVRGRATDFVAEHLRRRILLGELRPGDRIDYDELCKTLDVSRTPVREAILKLESEGLLTRKPYRVVVVSEVDVDSVADVYGVRLHLEVLAAAAAAARISENDLRELQAEYDVLTSLENRESSPMEFNTHNARFHDVIYRASGSAELRDYLNVLDKRCARMRLHFGVTGDRRVNEEHFEILEACRAHDEAGIVAAVRAHVLHACEHMLEQVPASAELPPVLKATTTDAERRQLERALAYTDPEAST